MESEKGTELPDSVEGEFEAGAKVEDSSSSLQTVYTNLTPVTIQDENGLRQIYVPVEQADTLTSLAESISDTTGNQQLSVSGIPGQLITITLPHGTTGAANQLQITDGTLLSLQENGDVPFSVTENDQINARQESATKDEHTIPMIVSDSEISQIHKEASSQGEIGSELLGTLLNAHDSSCNINKNKEDEFSSKKSDDFTAYIRTLLTQPHDGITDNSSQDETDEPVPPPERRSSVQLRPKTLPQVFSSIEANLSGALLNAIPGSKSAFLCNIEEECGVELKANSDDTFSFLCSESQIMNLYEKLSVLLPSAKNPFRHKEQRHKGVSCDLLRPMFSRSGREVKPKHYEIPVDDEPAQHDSDEEVKVLTGVKRKRGRPPKQVKTIGESSKKPSDYRKQIPRLATRKETDEAQTKDNVCISSHVENLANCTKAREMSSSVTVSTENLKGQTTEKHVETPTNIELDAGSSCDGLQVEEFVESNKGLNNVADGTLNLNEDSLKVLMKLDVEKTVPSTKNGLSDDKMMKVANLKPVKKSKSLVIKKRPKKDYESLLPFKYFCNQCSFKSKRQSHYSKHLQLHERGLPLLRCNQCNFTTIRLSHLRRHTLFHTSELHQCRNCKYRTYDMQHLNRHMKVKHPSVRNTVVKVFECPMCEYVTSTEFQYKRHLRVHADVSGGVENPDRIVASYQCPVCDYNTKKKDHFARHMKQVHTEHRPYLCDLCGKSFKRQDTLRSHKVVHMDKSVRLYPFRCNTCSKDFRTQAHLTEHLSTHSNSRQYLCEICGASFKTRNVQRKHVKTIHRNPRSHKCPDCDKSFNTKFALQRHARTHDTPGMRKVKQVSLVGEPETITIIPGVNDLTSVDHVTSATVQDIGAEEEHHVPPTVTSELQPSHVTVPVTTECGTLTETQQIAIPLPVEIQQQAHEVPATIQLGDTTHAVTLAEGTYEQDADGSLRQIIPHFIQTGDATTTLLYVPNL